MKRVLILNFIIIVIGVSCSDEETPQIIADFKSSAVRIVEGATVDFEDLSTGQPSKWSWSFEGGIPTESNIQNPSIIYPSAGTYTVILTASNESSSDRKESIGQITVIRKIIPSFISDQTSANQGTTINFSDNSEGDPTSWSWTFEDGNPSSSGSQNPSVVFTKPGFKKIKLVASNELSSESREMSILILPSDGLVLNYGFNGHTQDGSPNKNNGQVLGAVLTIDRNSKKDSAFFFDGIDDEIRFDHSVDLNSLPISVSFWVKFNSLKSAILGTDISDYQQSGVWFSIGQSAETLNKIAVNFGNGGSPSVDSRKTFIANKTLSVNEWYHIVGIVSNGSLSIYINNQLMTGSYTGFAVEHFNSEHNGSLGRVWDPLTFFHGSLDNIRIYNRALTSTEVNLLFQEP